MKSASVFLAVLIAFGLIFTAGCTGSPSSGTTGEEETIYITGAFALYPMMIKWSEEYRIDNPGVKFEISAGGAGKGMTDALSGMADIGMVSREIYPEEQSQGAYYVAVAKDAVVGTVNSNNPDLETIKKYGVTEKDLKEIYIDNSIKSWGDFEKMNGADSVINVYTRADACGAASIWASFIGDYAQEDINGIAVSGDPGLAEAVRADTYGVGFNNINYADASSELIYDNPYQLLIAVVLSAQCTDKRVNMITPEFFKKYPDGVGFNNINYAYDPTTGIPIEGITIIPLDLNENGVIDPNEDFYSSRGELMEAIANGIYPSPPARELNLVTKDEFSGATKEFVRWILTDGQKYVEETGYIPLSQGIIEENLNKVD